jgi:hypothetical protein
LNLSGNAYQHAGTGSGATASSRKSGGEFHTCRFAAAAAFVTKPVGGFLVSSGSALNVRRLATSLQRRLSGGVETDAEGITRPGYNAMGGASEEMRCGISCLGHQRDTRGRFRLQRVEIARNLYATHALSRPYERAEKAVKRSLAEGAAWNGELQTQLGNRWNYVLDLFRPQE